jgi:hypothetical protein
MLNRVLTVAARGQLPEGKSEVRWADVSQCVMHLVLLFAYVPLRGPKDTQIKQLSWISRDKSLAESSVLS